MLRGDRVPDAIRAFERAIELQPTDVPALRGLADALRRTLPCGRWTPATDPGDPPASTDLDQKAVLDRIVALLRRALKVAPATEDVRRQLGEMLLLQRRPKAARASFEAAIDLEPGDGSAHLALGVAARLLDDLDAASAIAARVVESDPGNGAAVEQLARVAFRRGDLLAAQELADRAAVLGRPADLSVLVRLASGDLREGWSCYEAAQAPWDVPSRWTGDALGGRCLIVRSDDPLATQIRLLSLLPDLACDGGDVLVLLHPELVPIAARSFPAFKVRARGDGVAASLRGDVAVSLAGLAALLRPSPADFPKRPAYLTPAAVPAPVERDRDDTRRTIGIALTTDLPAGPPQELWPHLRELPGTRFIALDTAAAALPGVVESAASPAATLDAAAALAGAVDAVVALPGPIAAVSAAVGTPTFVPTDQPDPFLLGLEHDPWQQQRRVVSRHWNISWNDTMWDLARCITAWIAFGEAAATL